MAFASERQPTGNWTPEDAQSPATFYPDTNQSAGPAPAAHTAPQASQQAPAPVDGINRCPQCGGSQVRVAGETLECLHCRYRWTGQRYVDAAPSVPAGPSGVSTSPGAAPMTDMTDLVTVGCSGCGASITINARDRLQSTCHWCRSVLSLNNPVPNGTIPDAILPFEVPRDRATALIGEYVARYATFAAPAFLADAAHAEPTAVYLPYLVTSASASVRLDGAAWFAAGETHDEGATTYSTVEYDVSREVAFTVENLPIEARVDRSHLAAAVSTANILSAIQPFDLEHAIRFDSRYIADGTTFERRDIEAADAMPRLADQSAALVRGYVNQTLAEYTGGVRWESERVTLHGARWTAMLLPVWIYSYRESTGTGSMLHYIAVNGRTGEVQGSIPVNRQRVARSALRWGVIASLIAAGLPLAFFVLSLSTALSQPDSGHWLPVAVSAIITAAFASIGLVVARWRKRSLTATLRHADERLEVEREVAYTPRDFRRADREASRFQHSGGPEIDGRNDHRPQDRTAAQPSVTVMPDGQLTPREFLWATTPSRTPSQSSRLRAGKMLSAPPPGGAARPTGWVWGSGNRAPHT